MSSAEHERLLRRARAQDVALFRYRLIGPALEGGLTTKQRGRVVRGIAGQVHAGPGGRGVQVSRKTIDRCSAPFFLSTWKRVGVVRHEHAGPGLAAGVRFRARRHCEHGAARCRSRDHGRGRMVVMMSFPGG